MEKKEILNKINETLDGEVNEYDGELLVFDGTDADGEYIKINLFDLNMLVIRNYSIERMTDLEIDHIGQMIRAAYMIARIRYLEGQRSGMRDMMYHMGLGD